MSAAARAWIVVTAVVAGLASVALVLVAVMADLDTAGQAASVAGAVVGLTALVVSVIALFRTGSPATGARSVQAGGAVGRAVTGDRNRLRSGAAPTPAPTSGPSSGHAVPGERGVSAAGGHRPRRHRRRERGVVKWWRGPRRTVEPLPPKGEGRPGPPAVKRGSSPGERAVDADGDLGVVVTGDHNSTTTIMGDVIVRGTSKAPPSVYGAEIRILAAAHFEGREKELAEMRAFALGTDPHGTGYWRWVTFSKELAVVCPEALDEALRCVEPPTS